LISFILSSEVATTVQALLPGVASGFWAVFVFSAILLCPGYALAWVCNLHFFRARTQAQRLVWSVALSFCVVPIASELVGKFAGLSAACWIAGLCAIACAAIAVHESRAGLTQRWGFSGIAVCGVLAWTLFAILEAIDIPQSHGTRLLMSVTIYDHALRTAFVDAVVRTGVPPLNPLYWPGHGALLRYYYFWYIPCAMDVKMAGVTARTALIASCAWGGFGLAAAIALFVEHFRDAGEALDPRRLRRDTIFGLALLSVTGLDLIPYVAGLIAGKAIPDPDWWSADQVTSWLDTLLWVPHHAAALVCCMAGFLLLWLAGQTGARRERWMASILAGVGFASAFGLSIWVATGFGLLMLGLLGYWTMRDRGRARLLTGSALVALILLLPFLWELRAADRPVSAPSAASLSTPGLLTFTVRRMIPSGALSGAPGFRTLRRSHPQVEEQLARLVLLPFGYVFELGFYGMVLLLALRRRRQLGEADRIALALATGCLLLTSFVGSTVIVNNDFGVRTSLIAQFFLLLLAVRLRGEWRGDLRLGMILLAGIGLAGTLAQAVALRVFLPVEESRGVAGYTALAKRSSALHRAYAEMDRKLPGDAVVAYLPDTSRFYNLTQRLDLGRQALNESRDCDASPFGGSPEACEGIERRIERIYTGVAAGQARQLCRELKADYLVAAIWEPVWQRKESWVWTLPPAIETDSVRILPCGTAP
jgi:hypothetical protein